jgi:vacuolar-type H+-ATPase subunit I/STV1
MRMPWLYLLLAVAALAIAFKTASAGVMVIALLAAFGLLLAWLMGLLAARMESRSGDPSMIVDPAELMRLREQAEARRAAASIATPPEG